MLDIRLFRDQPETVRTALVARGDDPTAVDLVVDLDAGRRSLLSELEELRAVRNRGSKAIASLSDRQARDEQIAAMRQVNERIAQLEQELRDVETRLEQVLLGLPNIPRPDVPVGPDERSNVVIRQVGEPPA